MDPLLELLRTRSFARREVTLSSGQKSDWFIDCKQAVLSAPGHAYVGERMYEACLAMPEPVVAVAGVELGGCPLASAVALHSFRAGKGLDALYVRKTAKEHGSKRMIEGDDLLPQGAAVAVLEDVITTGGSTLNAVEVLRARGLHVVGVVALVDRQESGGAARIAAAGLACKALYTRRDFMGE